MYLCTFIHSFISSTETYEAYIIILCLQPARYCLEVQSTTMVQWERQV